LRKNKSNRKFSAIPILEADASHNLEVANQYFKTKKAYKAVLMRFEETFAAYPDFSKMDEFLYLAGMSSFYLSENKGKQKVDTKSEDEKKRFAPEKLREDATAYLAQLVEKYPQSQYKTEAEKAFENARSEEMNLNQVTVFHVMSMRQLNFIENSD
jgi:outer membrane protein assembly factor BamD (BamD/ComL family)